MKKKFTKTVERVLFSVALVLCITTASQAAMILETTEFITGVGGNNYELQSTGEHSGYTATLSDLSFGKLSFDFLCLSISTSTQTLGYIEGPGSLSFNVAPDTTYFCNVFGVGGGKLDTGLYGVQVTAAPVPAALGLFASGLIALVAVRRRSA